ncbi:MAG TPA: hypothetical protein PLU55_04760 [Candidatus Pacearchaeota archaeon]|nr:hypothetical protein [Candidatus Pacearchaeota archaeon]
MKKITRATFKSFVKKNSDKLLAKVISDFNGMTDCVEHLSDAEYSPARKAEIDSEENNLGFNEIWLVGDSRDYFKLIDNEKYFGYHVSNCCGSFDIVIAK